MSDSVEPPQTSWPVATWTVPAVPGVVLALTVLVGAATGVTSQSAGYRVGLGLALAVVTVGWILLRAASGAGLRGLGAGLVAGGGATALGWVTVLLT